MNQLNLARGIALQAHDGQFRKDGVTPYYVHVEEVSNHSSLDNDEFAQAVALLHDAIEDSHFTANTLLNLGLDKVIVEAVVILTKKKGEKYLDYLEKVKSNPLARKVKIADMISNLADDPSERQIRKYAVGLEYLTK